MRATLSFNLDEEEQNFEQSRKGPVAFDCLQQISQEVFRPARKHGYNDPKIAALLEKLGGEGEDLVGLLEEAFYQILRDHDVTIW